MRGFPIYALCLSLSVFILSNTALARDPELAAVSQTEEGLQLIDSLSDEEVVELTTPEADEDPVGEVDKFTCQNGGVVYDTCSCEITKSGFWGRLGERVQCELNFSFWADECSTNGGTWNREGDTATCS